MSSAIDAVREADRERWEWGATSFSDALWAQEHHVELIPLVT